MRARRRRNSYTGGGNGSSSSVSRPVIRTRRTHTDILRLLQDGFRTAGQASAWRAAVGILHCWCCKRAAVAHTTAAPLLLGRPLTPHQSQTRRSMIPAFSPKYVGFSV